eukprot:CAMPEP_0180697436 /NCGR_PEP_ID=MMETSP1038_2-20121128/3496_1 /TAXON_ID=632150 /ORGANISM="Azadinium spinosum, Strain 3D9" /LENGTH=371 /DNA_ID=CAMNT_0022728951 /DNA_START=425 /DNA_END=1540 /DNA_ORIENTATION=-
MLHGAWTFFCGADRLWNWLDTVITVLNLLHVVIELVKLGLQSEADFTNTRIGVALRCVRWLRVARVIKLVETPFLQNLANMFAGLLIGIPWLFWVSVLLFLVIYILGIILRGVVGPAEGQNLLEVCGSGDFGTGYEGECKIHWLYGEEYFGTVPDAMFTVFRCVSGDCSSSGGQALAPHFGKGYGWRFYVVYSLGMLTIIFGIFNVITAIFVEATMQGLKYNDVQRKYNTQYESKYIERKCKELISKIDELFVISGDSADAKNCKDVFSHDEFLRVLGDTAIRGIISELDVNLSCQNAATLLDFFDMDASGYITLPAFLDTLMKMRGDPEKTDVIAIFVSLRSLSIRFTQLEISMHAIKAELPAHAQPASR